MTKHIDDIDALLKKENFRLYPDQEKFIDAMRDVAVMSPSEDMRKIIAIKENLIERIREYKVHVASGMYDEDGPCFNCDH